MLKTPLRDLPFSAKAFTCFRNCKIHEFSELVQFTKKGLVKWRGFGPKTLEEIEQVLRQKGLSFGMGSQQPI